MRVRELMSSPAMTCNEHDSLEHAARLLWENDCGALAVVGDDGAVHAVITDRDVCMGAYTRGARLAELAVIGSMSKELAVCRESDDVLAAASSMQKHRVRRLPVVDGKGMPVGMISLGDLTRAALKDAQIGRELLQTMAAICARPARSQHGTAAPVGTQAATDAARPPVVLAPVSNRPLSSKS